MAIKQVYSFLCSSEWSEEKKFKWQIKLLYTILTFVLFIILSMLLVTIFDLLGIEMTTKKTSSGFGNDYNNYITDNEAPFVSIIIAPFIEELGFRMPLKQFDERKVRLSFSVILGMIFSYTLYQIVNVPLNVYLVLIGFVSMIYLCFSNFPLKRITSFWNRNRLLILYLSVLLFAFVHVGGFAILNYSLNEYVSGLLAIVYVAFFITFLRTRYGFIYGLIFHILVNALVLAPSYLS